MKRMLVVLAHPDDESFFLGGTIAYYAKQGVEIQLLCATSGENGNAIISNAETLTDKELKNERGKLRRQELSNAAAILGIKNVTVLNFQDGFLCNAVYSELANIIIDKLESFAPQVVVTLDRFGVTGHLDHIAISMMTTYAFLKSSKAYKLYYFCRLRDLVRDASQDYFVYRPEGWEEKFITSRIDISSVFDIQIAAINEHQSQHIDAKRFTRSRKECPKLDYYILQYHQGVDIQLPESDLFSGISERVYE